MNDSRALSGEIDWAIWRVLSSPTRLKYLLRGGFGDATDLQRFLARIVPLARATLHRLAQLADRIPDPEIRKQAIFTLGSKAYHTAGACILATFLPSGAREHYVDIVAPLESIYDFLDSLCDRHPQTRPQAFRQLHEALSDALDPARPLHEYYAFGPIGDDGEYLASLVHSVRRALSRLNRYELLLPHFRRAAALYTNAQSYAHLPAGEREAACIEWHACEGASTGDLAWWEFVAAAGSQFHVYAPLYEAFRGDFERIGTAYDAYFPPLCALHVLLDAFIDQQEDREHGELNWIACYPSQQAFLERARVFVQRANAAFERLGMPRAHRFTLRIMLLFYLTHPKVYRQNLDAQASALLQALSR